MAEETCRACKGSGTVRAWGAQGEPCPGCEGRGTVTVADAPAAPMTVEVAIEADLAKSTEPGEPPKAGAAAGDSSAPRV
jgi:DnaJ-class molecular chaperone